MSRSFSSLDCKIYVGDLPKDATEREVERAFSAYGSVRTIWVARNPAGFAFVEFDDSRDAEDAVRALDGSNICGVRARVEFATGKSKTKSWEVMPRADTRMRRGPGPGRRAFNPDDKCYECGSRGHYAYDCEVRLRKQRRTRRSRSRSYSRRSRSRSRGRRSSRDRSRSRSRSKVSRSRSRSRRSRSRSRSERDSRSRDRSDSRR